MEDDAYIDLSLSPARKSAPRQVTGYPDRAAGLVWDWPDDPTSNTSGCEGQIRYQIDGYGSEPDVFNDKNCKDKLSFANLLGDLGPDPCAQTGSQPILNSGVFICKKTHLT